MTPEETAALLACSDQADALVRRRLGFIDEDVAQEVREAMVRSVDTYNPTKGTSLKTWLLKKGGYRAVDAYREARGRNIGPTRKAAIRNPLSLDHPAPGSATPQDEAVIQAVEAQTGVVDDGFEQIETRLTAAQIAPAVIAALECLSERDRTIVLERIAGNTLNEIADIHGVTESRVSQICRNFRNRFDELAA